MNDPKTGVQFKTPPQMVSNVSNEGKISVSRPLIMVASPEANKECEEVTTTETVGTNIFDLPDLTVPLPPNLIEAVDDQEAMATEDRQIKEASDVHEMDSYNSMDTEEYINNSGQIGYPLTENNMNGQNSDGTYFQASTVPIPHIEEVPREQQQMPQSSSNEHSGLQDFSQYNTGT
jgi:hypothetical protein